MDNTRRDRFVELSKNKNRTPVEETERAALAAEFPETAAEFESNAAAEEERQKAAADKAAKSTSAKK